MGSKILHVVNSMNPVQGGVCKAVQTISISLIGNGIENEVVSLDNPNENFIKQSSFKIHALGSTKNPWGYHPELLPWLQNNIINYSIIVVHGLWLYNSYATYKSFSLMLKKNDIKKMIQKILKNRS